MWNGTHASSYLDSPVHLHRKFTEKGKLVVIICHEWSQCPPPYTQSKLKSLKASDKVITNLKADVKNAAQAVENAIQTVQEALTNEQASVLVKEVNRAVRLTSWSQQLPRCMHKCSGKLPSEHLTIELKCNCRSGNSVHIVLGRMMHC
jgi:hypothetical protein